MIVWGGAGAGGPGLSTGGRYDPDTNTWIEVSQANAPSPRYFHTAVWTGGRMIVFGGRMGAIDNASYTNTGGRYDPSTNTWSATSTVDAPTARSTHTALWTGDEMIVWGGCSGSTCSTQSYNGALYDSVGDGWTAISLQHVPSARSGHSAVWTGNSMIVWGGVAQYRYTSSGAIYYRAACAMYDMNCDGTIDISDVIMVSGYWNCALGSYCYVQRLDLNGDEAISIADVMIVVAHWTAQ